MFIYEIAYFTNEKELIDAVLFLQTLGKLYIFDVYSNCI